MIGVALDTGGFVRNDHLAGTGEMRVETARNEMGRVGLEAFAGDFGGGIPDVRLVEGVDDEIGLSDEPLNLVLRP